MAHTSTPAPVLILGREPAWWTGLGVASVAAVSAFIINVPMDAQAAINAILVAAGGLVTAAVLRDGKVLAAILGLAQAVMLLAVTYGFDLPPEKQAILLALVTAVAQGYLRTQAIAPVPPVVIEPTARNVLPQ